jgi:predicted acylesterase/phospholipase RssA
MHPTLHASNVDSLVFSSGGAKAFPVFLAVLKELVCSKRVHLPYIRRAQGTSAGAAVAMCIALRLDVDKIDEVARGAMRDAENMELYPGGLFVSMGLNDGSSMETNLKAAFTKASLDSSMSFADLHAARRVDLVVIASNIQDGSAVVFSKDTTPSCKVIDGVIASMTIPFVFPPRKITIDNTPIVCVDGAISDPFPLGTRPTTPKCNEQSTIGIRVYSTCQMVRDPTEVSDVLSMGWHLFVLMFTKLEACDFGDYFVINVAVPSPNSALKITKQQCETYAEIARQCTSSAVSQIVPLELTRSVSIQTD